MRKPGATFAFEPKNNLAAEDAPQFKASPKRNSQKKNDELRQSFYDLFQATTISLWPAASFTSNTRTTASSMARSRSESFGDDDLQVISQSQTAAQSPPSYTDLTSTPAKDVVTLSSSPALNRNAEIIDLSNSPALAGRPAQPAPGPSTAPAFGRPTALPSAFNRKPVNIFNVPRNGVRVEHHRDHKDLYRVKGPLAPKIQGKKAAPPQLFSSVGPSAHPPASPVKYARAATELAYMDAPAYTDPARASADLKALLEGGIEEDDEDKEHKETIEDGSVEGIKTKLLPHQVEGVKWMRSREVGPIKKGKLPKGGILADDMGLGKTLQSVTLIVTNPLPKKDEEGWKDRFSHLSKGTLVVAPLALIRQWEAEIKDKVSPGHALKVCVHHGPQRTKSAKELMKYDVVITTYQILVSEHGNSSPDPDGHQAGCFGVRWYRVILDEAHSIKNRNAKATKAACALRSEYRWCLTGTPMQNNLDELQSLIHFLRVQPYDDLAEWRAHIDLPMKKGQGHIAIRRLHSLLRCFMKRRTKEVLKEEGALLPGGKKALDEAAAKAKREGKEYTAPKSAFKITERKVVTVATEFSPAEREFYDQLEARADKSIEKMMQGKVNYANALVLLLRLRQACNHPRLTEAKVDKDRDALAAETAAQPERKVVDADVDDLADIFGGMGIKTKQCEMCLNDLTGREVADGHLRCAACVAGLMRLNGETPERKRPKKKGRRISVVEEEVKVEAKTRRKARGRNIVMDSSDEEEEGSWLVSEDQRGSLRLGKAGGEEDENAEGVGEDIGSEDSAQSEDDDRSKLSSFVVDDEQGSAVHSDEEETFLSVTKMRSQLVVPQQSASATSDSEAQDSADGSGVSESELASDSDSDSDGQVAHRHRRTPKASKKEASHVLQSAKIRELISILKKEVGEHKFIVFSQFTSMLDLIEPFFRAQAGFKFVRYDGGMKNDAREAALHALRSDPHTRILLCSLKCGSLGLNLTAATRVVILEPFWNPFVEEQAIDRVHRLTQTVDVVVYKLTVADTVEERILELQNKKRLLAEATIEGGMRKKDKNALKLGLQEILALFKHRSSAGPEGFVDPLGVADDVGGMLRSSRNLMAPKRKETKAEHAVYGRRW
ncbi:Transcription termination factor 2 [Coniochaeta hoffmannii]|uniref:Transcription termination factor 2 n=1 Tax=Coniochaeta hoffmannii TaxID=91930 RepID=A0AA38RMV0_9PEZI|nr:Transcription termination factor 2 [Coniochaeta hoffmannii]